MRRARSWTEFAALAIAGALTAAGQTGLGTQSGRNAGAANAPTSAPSRPIGEVVLEIDDPSSGDRWLLTRGDAGAGGPGRFVRVEGAGGAGSEGARAKGSVGHEANADRAVIRAGDSIVLEEHTARIDARLEATALNGAAAGSELKARLKIGGKIVHAIAVKPGLATIVPERRAGQ